MLLLGMAIGAAAVGGCAVAVWVVRAYAVGSWVEQDKTGWHAPGPREYSQEVSSKLAA